LASDCTIGREFDQLSDYSVLKKDCTPWSIYIALAQNVTEFIIFTAYAINSNNKGGEGDKDVDRNNYSFAGGYFVIA
jgi:hypothetical protein